MTAPSGQRLPRRTAIPAASLSGRSRGRITSGSTSSASSRCSTRGRPVTVRASGSSRSATSRSTARRPPARWRSSIRWRPGRLQVDQQGHPGADAVEVLQRQVDPQPAGQGQQVDDAVGRPADGGQGDDRVAERPGPQEAAGPAVGGDQLDGQPAALVGPLQQPAVGCRGAGDAGDGGPEGLGQAGHGRGGAHGVAVAAAADHRRLGLEEGVPGQPARPHLLAEAPHVGAAAQRGAPEVPGEHRPAGHDQGRQVDRGRRHEQGRDGLVAAAEQHGPVDRVGPQQLLGGHRGQVAPEHRRRPHLGLAQRHHRQVQRDPAQPPRPPP